MSRVAQDRAGGEDDADRRRDDQSGVAHGDLLEVRAEGEEQRDHAGRSPEQPEQVQAPFLPHDRVIIPARCRGRMTVPSRGRLRRGDESVMRTPWVRAPAGDARRVDSFDTVQRAWWSADGSSIYALMRGEGQDGIVVEAASGRRIATIPGDAPRNCP